MTREKVATTKLEEQDPLPLYDDEGELIPAEDAILRSPKLREQALWLHKMEKRLGDIPEPSCVVLVPREEVAPAK